MSHAFIERLKNTPLARTLIADDERELDAQRAVALATIKDARARAQREIPPLQARVVNRLDNLRAAEKAVVSAQAEHRRVAGALTLASDDETSAVRRAEAELIETAPDAVKEFLDWLSNEFERVRHDVKTYPAGATGNPQLGERKHAYVQTNAPSTKAYIASIHAARQEVHRLVLTEPSRAAIEARLVQIQRGLPDSIEMQVVEAPTAG